MIEGIATRNVDGTSSAWDRVPNNGIWAIAVDTEGNLRNRSDGSVRFAVEGRTSLDFWVADNGSITAGSTRYEVIVRFNDGTAMRGIGGHTKLNLWLADNGKFSVVPEKFDVFVVFEDARILKNSIARD
ncbi:MAG: hypothetical protein ACLFN0_05000 [Thermovirgaceae bacterium]